MKEVENKPSGALPDSLRDFDSRVARVGWRSWAMLGLFGGTIGVAIFWSVAGDIPTRVRGNCIVMYRQGVVDISADAPGRITRLLVQPGTLLSAGQQVAVLTAPELSERVLAARARLADLEAAAGVTAQEQGRAALLATQSASEQRIALGKRIASDQQRIRILGQQVETNARMRGEGLITARAAASARLDLDDARSSLADTERRLAALAKLASDEARQRGELEASSGMQVNDARRVLASLLTQEMSATQLRSRVAGRVIEIKAAAGSLVRRDTPVLGLERFDAPRAELEAVMYVSAADGKKIAREDDVQIELSHAPREEYGVLLAKVKSTSEYPATPQGLLNTLANPDLVRELARGAAPYELRIALAHAATPPAAARNPYAWSSKAGALLPLSSGALCSGEILVRHERPISLVLPIFRSTVGGSAL